MSTTRKLSTKTLVLGAILTALVFLLQYMGSFIKLGPFSISLVLIPIVIGAATCGVEIATWLGFVFGVAVLLSGDAAAFLAITVPGTLITVLAKGALCGLCSAATYKLSQKLGLNQYISVVFSAIVCPIVNTGVFLICCFLFFYPTMVEWAGGGNVIKYMLFVLVGVNFLVEMITNVILSPVVSRILSIRK